MKLLYPLAKRFIAGHDFDSAKPAIEKLIGEGYEVSVDYIGEDSIDYDQCKEASSQYFEVLKYFKNFQIDLSIKPSQLGLNIHPYLCYLFLNKIVKKAAKQRQTVRLDMEDSAVTDRTIELAIKLNKEYGNVGVAVQANLTRTTGDLKNLMEQGVSVRLVKGAYKEETSIAYQKDYEIGGAFFDCAARLYSNKANKPAIATHDEELLRGIKELIPDFNYYDYEFLYGIRRDLQKKYKEEGRTVRIYIPFGTRWLPYTMRRLREWKNLKFVIKNIFKEWFND